MSALHTHASKLCRFLNDSVLHEEMTELDLLDALASCELTLVEDQTGEAAITYHGQARALSARERM